MANKQAYPNQNVGFELSGFGPDGMPPSVFIVLSGSGTIDGGSPITGTVIGVTVFITIPANQSLGTITLALSWSQNLNGVVSNQGPVDYLVDIIAAPSGSSQSFVPTNITRQCLRLCEPADTTDEQIVFDRGQAHLQIYCTPPYSILRSIFANLPSSGPDLLVMSYVDASGQPGQLGINCVLYMSDNSYIFVTADNGVQVAVASINAAFFDANAVEINTRNATAGALPILPCANASRYDWPTLLPNEAIPLVFYYDGILISSGTSSSPNVI